jgi:hypothetical protein
MSIFIAGIKSNLQQGRKSNTAFTLRGAFESFFYFFIIYLISNQNLQLFYKLMC